MKSSNDVIIDAIPHSFQVTAGYQRKLEDSESSSTTWSAVMGVAATVT